MTTNGNGTNGNHSGLTIKQQVWLDEYLRCWNGAEAARIAGYKYPRQAAYANITKDYIKEAIHKRLAVKAMGADEVLVRLADQARGDISAFFRRDEDDGMVTLDWDAILHGPQRHLIRSITFTRAGPKIEIHDAQHALAHLGKHHGLFVDRVEHTGKDGEPIEIADARVRFTSLLNRLADPDSEGDVSEGNE